MTAHIWRFSLVLVFLLGSSGTWVWAQQPVNLEVHEGAAAETIIIGIHGLLNKPPQDQLEDWWEKAIAEGLERNEGYSQPFSFDFAYWADIRNPEPLALEELDEPYVPAEGTGSLTSYDPGVMDTVRRIANKYGGRVLDKEKDLIGLGTHVEKLLGVSFEDLADYYEKDEIRKSIRKRLIATLEQHQKKKIILVAHSMGSIVGYDVLRLMEQHSPEFRVNTFLTIGSPLGLPIVAKKIRAPENFKETRSPSNINQWINVADPGDKVALDCNLADEYKPNASGLVVKDILVHNDYKDPKGKSNNHKSYGYLRAPEVSKILAAFLTANGS